MSIRETAFECLLAISKGDDAVPADDHIVILCELAELSDDTARLAYLRLIRSTAPATFRLSGRP
jgi:hypothetical protein